MFVLHAERVQPPPWGTRIKIAMDAARGLEFLHTTENTVIYRDFKAANILLDEVKLQQFSAHFCDWYMIYTLQLGKLVDEW